MINNLGYPNIKVQKKLIEFSDALYTSFIEHSIKEFLNEQHEQQ